MTECGICESSQATPESQATPASQATWPFCWRASCTRTVPPTKLAALMALAALMTLNEMLAGATMPVSDLGRDSVTPEKFVILNSYSMAPSSKDFVLQR